MLSSFPLSEVATAGPRWRQGQTGTKGIKGLRRDPERNKICRSNFVCVLGGRPLSQRVARTAASPPRIEATDCMEGYVEQNSACAYNIRMLPLKAALERGSHRVDARVIRNPVENAIAASIAPFRWRERDEKGDLKIRNRTSSLHRRTGPSWLQPTTSSLHI